MSKSRRIDLPPYPRGWFAVAVSDELGPGEVRPLHFFGQELVLFRTQAGEAALFDAYCPHLGAHLGHGGTVDGGVLTCPFHAWRFSTEGTCVGMPYGKRIPAAAQARKWSVLEQNGVILAWHSPDGSKPDWVMRKHDDGNWIPAKWKRWEILGHPQEVCENGVDFAHLRFIHGTHIARLTGPPTIDGAYFESEIESDPEALEDRWSIDETSVALKGSNHIWGPGLVFASIGPKGADLDVCQRLYCTPIDGDRVQLLGMVNVGRLDSEAATRQFADALIPEVFAQWEADVPIWEHKVYRPKPALNEREGEIVQFRHWYQQFYA